MVVDGDGDGDGDDHPLLVFRAGDVAAHSEPDGSTAGYVAVAVNDHVNDHVKVKVKLKVDDGKGSMEQL